MKRNNLQIKAFGKSDLVKLAQGRRNGGLTTSFYLGLKPDVNFRSEANSVLAREAECVKKNKAHSKSAKKKILAMINLLKKEINFLRLPSEARTLVFFLEEKSGVLAYRIPAYVPSKIVVELDYYIHPLVKIIEEFSRYLVAAIEMNKAEFFGVFLGEIEGEPEVLLSDVPKKIRTSSSDDWKGRREQKIERHIEDHLSRHFKAVALKIRDYFEKKGFDRLVVGGHGEIKAKFQKFLDKKSVKKLIGFFSLSHSNHGFIKERSSSVINEYEKSVEEKIVDDLVNSVGGKKWKAAAGIDAVLENFYLHKIKMFVIGSNYKNPGFVCGRCHHIYLFSCGCASCGGKTVKVDDIIDEIMEEAIKNKIKVRQLFYRHKKFDRFGVGAFLKGY